MLARGRWPEYTILTGRSAAHHYGGGGDRSGTKERRPRSARDKINNSFYYYGWVPSDKSTRGAGPGRGRTQRKTSAGSIISSMALLIKVIISLSAQGHPTKVGGWMDGYFLCILFRRGKFVICFFPAQFSFAPSPSQSSRTRKKPDNNFNGKWRTLAKNTRSLSFA